MKRILGLSLLVTVFAAVMAFGQSIDDSLYVWYGGSFDGLGNWIETTIARVDANVDVKTYMLCTDGAYIADLHLPLGVKDQYIENIPKPLCSDDFFPFNQWDEHSFLDAYEGPPTTPAGYHSRSFFGIYDLVGGPNPPLHYTTIQQGLLFVVKTVNDPTMIGNTYCDALIEGRSSTLGPPAAGDTLGGAGYTVQCFYSCLFFSPNTPPTIHPFNLPADFCGYCYSDFTFEVTDAEGNMPLTVTARYNSTPIPVVKVDEYVDAGGVTHWTGYLDLCGLAFQHQAITIEATDGMDPAVPYVIPDYSSTGLVGKVTAYLPDSFPMWAGFPDWIPVYFDDCNSCFCMGGFEFTITYDPSILTLEDVRRGDVILGGEYWFVNYNARPPYCDTPYPPGAKAVDITFINDLNNQIPARPICDLDDVPLFWLKFTVNPLYTYPVGFCIPICFYMCEPRNYDWNAVSDPTGYNVWKTEGCGDSLQHPTRPNLTTNFLELRCGNIKIVDSSSVDVGDINMNGQTYEVGDATLLANYLMDPITYPLNIWQRYAADINRDGYLATIADLILLLNIVNGTAFPGGKLAPLDVPAIVSMPVNASGDVNVTITSEATVGGAVVEIRHEGVTLGAPTAEGMDLLYSDRGDVMTVVVYSRSGKSLAAGSHTLFTVPVTGEGRLTFGEVSVSDNIGHLLSARGEVVTPLPTEFAVAQNFPNPFNAKTSISFALPTEANVTVTIYNVAGQVVHTIDAGKLNAGTHSVVWDASNVSSGVYFYKVTAGDFSKTMKMTLLK